MRPGNLELSGLGPVEVRAALKAAGLWLVETEAGVALGGLHGATVHRANGEQIGEVLAKRGGLVVRLDALALWPATLSTLLAYWRTHTEALPPVERCPS